MIKLVCFDLDGVLADSREMHFYALNDALKEIGSEYVISKEEHLAKYDGRSTTEKLKMLTVEKGLPSSVYSTVWNKKQDYTLQYIDSFGLNEEAIKLFQQLRARDIKVAVVSNSIRETTKRFLLSLGLMREVHFFLTNEDVKRPKPNPEIYLLAMQIAGVGPLDTLIIEDSHIGREAAIKSGAQLHGISNPSELLTSEVINIINKRGILGSNIITKWQGKSMNIVIPMAGEGSRFQQAGYTFPKPLIDVYNKPMIQVVVENLNIDANYIFIVRSEHYEKYNMKYVLNLISPNCKIILTDGLTQGSACSVLLAKEYINNDNPLLIANSDQYVDWNSNQFMYSMIADSIDGGILTFNSTHPKWSFAKINDDGFVVEVAEKKPISDNATVGIYYYKHGRYFVESAEEMIRKNIRTNNEFYTCPVFNEMIQNNKKIKIFKCNNMWGLGTPEDLNHFTSHGPLAI